MGGRVEGALRGLVNAGYVGCQLWLFPPGEALVWVSEARFALGCAGRGLTSPP